MRIRRRERAIGERVYSDSVETLRLIQCVDKAIDQCTKRPVRTRPLRKQMSQASRLVRSMQRLLKRLRNRRVRTDLGRSPAVAELKARLVRLSARRQGAIRQELFRIRERLLLDAIVRTEARKITVNSGALLGALRAVARAVAAGNMERARRHARRAIVLAATNCELSLTIAITTIRYRQQAIEAITQAVLITRSRPAA